jgi:hypothetical protein
VSKETPFIGPRPFKEAEAEIFFGRKNELAELAAEVASAQIVLIYAPSGSGKSSLISAGLIPFMRGKGFKVSQERLNTFSSSDEQSRVNSLCEAIKHSALQSSAQQPSLLVLDQFEEIVLAATYAELQELSETIFSTMAENPLARIVISFREEYLARTDALFNKVTEVSVGNFHLDRLSGLGALEAFERSLNTVRFEVEGEAGQLFLEKLAPPTRRLRSEAGFEPLYLQLLGYQLWSSIANRASATTSKDAAGLNDIHRVVTVADVSSLVDFDQAIELFFDSTIGEVCASHHVVEKVMRDWIDLKLVTPDETRSMVRRQLSETDGLPTNALDDLVKRGLLRTEPRGDDLWLELAHDQLVERVREFNRIWWNGQVYTNLLHRDTRSSIAFQASIPDALRWFLGRSTIWSYSTTVREAGIQLSHWSDRWLPFVQKRSSGELDRLTLRTFLVTSALFNSLVSFYRLATNPVVPATLNDVEGLDGETAKRRLQATSLNLGRTEQLLTIANISVTVAWAQLLSRLIITRSAVGAPPMDRRRRLYAGLLFSTDVTFALLRWAIRNGLIKNCLDGADQIQRPRVLRRGEVGGVRRCRSLQDAASWSRDHPVLLVLDWRRGVDGPEGFDRFLNQEVPLYNSALRARGAIVAWCCRADVQRRGWRKGVSGIGLPSRGQRTYYMIEHGNVVAWRMVKTGEFPARLRTVTASAEGGATPIMGQEVKIRQRFIRVLTALIVSGEAAPSPWREFGEQYFRSVLGLRRSDT